MLSALLICCAICGADEPAKPAKELSPKEKREMAIKDLKAKMEPIEKKLTEAKEDLGYAKSAPVNGKGGSITRISGTNRVRHLNYRTAEKKQEDIDKHTKAIAELTEQLKPLQDKLKELQKPAKPEPKPEPKEPPKAPEKP